MIKVKYTAAITDHLVRWWDLAPGCVAAFQAKGAKSYESSKTNLASPGLNDATDGAAFPTWDIANGWTFASASSQYLNVGSGALLSAVPISIVGLFKASSTASMSLGSICRTSTEDNRFHLFANFATVRRVAAATVNGSTVTTAISSATYTSGAWSTGFALFIATNNRVVYINGANGIADVSSATPAGVNATYIGARHNATSLGTFMDGNIGAIAFYNSALTASHVIALHYAMNAL